MKKNHQINKNLRRIQTGSSILVLWVRGSSISSMMMKTVMRVKRVNLMREVRVKRRMMKMTVS